MKLTKKQLIQIINENLASVLLEVDTDSDADDVDPEERTKLRRSLVKSYVGSGARGRFEILEKLWMMLNPEGASTRLSAVKNPETIMGSDVNLLFDGDFLHWRDGDATIVKFPAIAGETPWNEESWLRYYKDVKDFSTMQAQGPPPEGEYKVGGLQKAPGQAASEIVDLESEIASFKKFEVDLWNKVESGDITIDDYNKKVDVFSADDTDFYDDKLKSRFAWGNYRASFVAKKGTETHRRSGFYIHGGNQVGSHGCIDLLTHMDDFAKILTFWSSQSRNKRLDLTVKYAPQFSDLVNKWVDVWDDGFANKSQNVESMLEDQLSFLEDDEISMTDKAIRVAKLSIKHAESFPLKDVVAYMKRQGYTLSNIRKFMKSVYDYLAGKDLEDKE